MSQKVKKGAKAQTVVEEAKVANTPPKKEKKKKEPQDSEEKKAAVQDEHVLQPKRPTSAYIYFNTETTAKLRKEGMAHTEAFKKCGELWKALSDK